MKLKHISCTQFAGVRDCDISFKDGVNVVFGKNESGKSTMVNLISRTLFQNAKIDGRRDKEFVDLFFPAAKRGSQISGDFVDGKVTMETEQGTYKLSKEWGADARCTLSTPDGVIRDQASIDAAMKELLVYGEGVYTDLLLSSQRTTDAALRTILDASLKTVAKSELVDVVSQAFAESDGISIDALEQAIASKIEALEGKHWDFEREMPVRKAGGGRHLKQVGEVLSAYYALQDAEAVLEELTELEQDADRTSAIYIQKDADAESARMNYEEFRVFESRIALQAERKKEVAGLEDRIAKYAKVLAAWPEVEARASRAKELQQQRKECALLERYEAARTHYGRKCVLLEAVKDRTCPAASEITAVRAAQRRVSVLENKLCGMNIAAAFMLSEGYSAELRSVRTGELLQMQGENFAITEAATLTVPGVLELRLAPADVDVAQTEEKISEEKRAIAEILSKYEVTSLEGLEQLEETLSRAGTELESVENKLQLLLGSLSFEDLAQAVSALPGDTRKSQEIEHDIRDLCAGVDLDRFAATAETYVEGYEKDYGSMSALKALYAETIIERDRAASQLGGDDIPAQYLAVTDPGEHLQMLRDILDQKQLLRENALTAKTAAVSRLETYQQNCSDDPEETVRRAKNALHEKKALLAHWKHIAEVFAKQKEAVRNDPMQDISEHFARYLDVLSDGGVASEFPEKDKLNIRIYSHDRLIDHGKLSEGTRETVSLAFRFAVLDHLFPDGGGLIVLDDPFTDMDAERTTRACDMVKECAKRHQIIFLTCKEEYLPMLEGNNIYL